MVWQNRDGDKQDSMQHSENSESAFGCLLNPVPEEFQVRMSVSVMFFKYPGMRMNGNQMHIPFVTFHVRWLLQKS